MSASDSDNTTDNAAHGGCPAVPCSACGYDPFVLEAAKAAVNTLRRDLDRECLKNALHQQDIDIIRKIIRKGGTAAEIIKFLDTPSA
jgi:hypothetical protein